MKTRAMMATAVLATAVLAGCAAAPPQAETGETSGAQPAPDPSAAGATPDASAQDAPAQDAVVGTVVRFASDSASVDVTIDQDTPAVRDFLALLPLEVEFEDLGGREKIAYLPRALDVGSSPGSDPEDGDLIYYTPWGNLGFYYDASGIGYSDATVHIGTYEATADELALLEGSQVTIEIVR